MALQASEELSAHGDTSVVHQNIDRPQLALNDSEGRQGGSRSVTSATRGITTAQPPPSAVAVSSRVDSVLPTSATLLSTIPTYPARSILGRFA